jgi:hypothetical protein
LDALAGELSGPPGKAFDVEELVAAAIPRGQTLDRMIFDTHAVILEFRENGPFAWLHSRRHSSSRAPTGVRDWIRDAAAVHCNEHSPCLAGAS